MGWKARGGREEWVSSKLGNLNEVGEQSIFPSLRPGMSLPPPRPLVVPQARKGSPTGTVSEL